MSIAYKKFDFQLNLYVGNIWKIVIFICKKLNQNENNVGSKIDWFSEKKNRLFWTFDKYGLNALLHWFEFLQNLGYIYYQPH